MHNRPSSSRPLVSVLTTAYNGADYIAEAIESVLASTYTNFELIVVDDCSTDRTIEIARSFELRDERIKVYANATNIGDYPNRNRAAAYAKGKYLKYLDWDDLIYPHGLSVMVESMETFPGAALGLSQEIRATNPFPNALSPRETYVEEFLGKGLLGIGPTEAIILKKVFEKEGGFLNERYVGDTELWLRLAMKYPIVMIQPGLVWHRCREGSELHMESMDGSSKIRKFLITLEMLENASCPLEPALRTRARKKLIQHHARRILALFFKKMRFRKAWQFYRQSEITLLELLGGLRRYI